MGQSTTSTLVTLAESTSRVPYCSFVVDWYDNGFASYGIGSWVDESSYVKEVRGDMQAVSWQRSIAAVGTGVSDVCYVTCRNPESSGGYSGLRFSPSNSNGPLYSYLTYTDSDSGTSEAGINMVRAVVTMGFYSGTYYGSRQITGYIVGIRENYKERTVTFEIRDRAADAALTRASTALYSGTTAKSYLETLCALLDRDVIASGYQDFDDGLITMERVWLDDETIWDEMSIIAQAQAGRIWFDKDGILHFDDGSHFIKPNSNAYDDPTTSQATLTTASFQDIGPRYDIGSVYNHIIVEYQPRYIGQEQVIYARPDVVMVRPDSTVTVTAEFRYPVYSITTPVSGTDFVAVTAGGTSLTSSCTCTLGTEYAGRADITLVNTDTDYTAYFTTLQLQGYPLLTEESSVYETEDTTSIAVFGRRTWTVRSNPYIQTYRHAQMVGDFMLARYKDPIQVVSLRGIPARPWLEPGDRVTVTETLTDISDDYFIATIGWSWSPGKSYLMNLDLMRCSDLYQYTDWFTIGTSRYGTGTDKGRLFW